MRIIIKHLSSYKIELTNTSGELFNKTKTTIHDRYTIDSYDILPTNNFRITAIALNKKGYKYKLFKAKWFAYVFSSFLSFDYDVRKVTYNVEIAERENSEVEIYIGNKQVKTALNGYVNIPSIENIKTKKASLKKEKVDSIDKFEKKHLLVSLIFGMMINILIYSLIPILYMLILVFLPFLIRGESFIDYFMIAMLFVIPLINIVRYYINCKDIIESL